MNLDNSLQEGTSSYLDLCLTDPEDHQPLWMQWEWDQEESDKKSDIKASNRREVCRLAFIITAVGGAQLVFILMVYLLLQFAGQGPEGLLTNSTGGTNVLPKDAGLQDQNSSNKFQSNTTPDASHRIHRRDFPDSEDRWKAFGFDASVRKNQLANYDLWYQEYKNNMDKLKKSLEKIKGMQNEFAAISRWSFTQSLHDSYGLWGSAAIQFFIPVLVAVGLILFVSAVFLICKKDSACRRSGSVVAGNP